MRVSSACLTQQSAQSVFVSSPEASKTDVTLMIKAENATGLVEMVNETDGSRVQPTHHGGVWGFVPYLSNSRYVHHSQQSTPQIHNKSWRSGNLHPSAWVEGHTGGSRSIPTAHPCSQNGRRLWVARKHHNLTRATTTTVRQLLLDQCSEACSKLSFGLTSRNTRRHCSGNLALRTLVNSWEIVFGS